VDGATTQQQTFQTQEICWLVRRRADRTIDAEAEALALERSAGGI
jgi:hypothetical protein